MRPSVFALSLLVPALAACGARAAPPSAGPSESVTAIHHVLAPTLRQIVHDSRARLNAVEVAPGPHGYTVSAWWVLQRGPHSYGAIVTSDDSLRRAAYRPGTYRVWRRHAPAPVKGPGPRVPAFRGLLAKPVISLRPGTRAYIAGGDGATLLPFDATARSVAHGPWTGYVVPTTNGDRAYDEGDLVLPDGRLLVLLDAWSSDRGTHHGPEHHGLWVSKGDDWSSYAPYRPRFTPALAAKAQIATIQAEPAASDSAPHGLVVAVTSDNLLYVSVDGARTFQAIADR